MSARKIAYNTIAQVGGKFIGFFISSFFLIILASALGTEGMGYYTTVTAFVAFFVNLADLGINMVMMREVAQNPDQRERITGSFLGFRLVFSVLVMALAPVVALLVPQYNTLVVFGVVIAALAQFLLLINQTFVSVLQVSLRLDRAVLAEVVNRLLTLLFVVIGAHYYATNVAFFFYYVLWVTVGAAGANMAISYFFARKEWSFRPSYHTSEWRKILLLVAPMGLFSFLSMVHFKSDTIILSLLKPAYDVGIYGYAYKISEIMFSIPMMFIGIVFPTMSVLIKGNRAEFQEFCQKIFSVLLFISIPFIAAVYLLAPYLTTLLSRQSVTDGLIAGRVLQVLSLAMIAWFFGALFQHILLADTEYKGLTRNVALAAAINIGLNFIFIPRYSYFAASTVTVITEAIMLLLTVFYVRKQTGFMPRFQSLFPISLAAIGMYGAVALCLHGLFSDVTSFASAPRITQMGGLFVLSLVGVVVYIGLLSLWGKSSPVHTFLQMLRKRPPSGSLKEEGA